MPTASSPAEVGSPDEDTLVRTHLPLAHHGVRALSGRIPRHVSREDLTSAAMFGLAQAARSYDPSKGIPFDRYAALRIRGALLDELRSRDWASRSVRRMARKMEKANDAVSRRTGRKPSVAETAMEMGVEVARVERLVNDVHRGTVLNYESPFADGNVADVLPDSRPTPSETLISRERRAFLMDAVVSLPVRLRQVVVSYFFDEMSMVAIAEEMGVSESRVSQMRSEALGLMRQGINANLDPDQVPTEARPQGRVARKHAAYYKAIRDASTTMDRLDVSAGDLTVRLGASEVLAA